MRTGANIFAGDEKDQFSKVIGFFFNIVQKEHSEIIVVHQNVLRMVYWDVPKWINVEQTRSLVD